VRVAQATTVVPDTGLVCPHGALRKSVPCIESQAIRAAQAPRGTTNSEDSICSRTDTKVIEWLRRHGRFTFHFTPTWASWINAVEGFFAPQAQARRLPLHRRPSGRYQPLRQRSKPEPETLPLDQGIQMKSSQPSEEGAKR
jgi:hypothetical protein